RLRDLLAGGRQDPAHTRPEIVLAEHQTRRRIGETRAHPHFHDPLADRILHPLEQALAFLQLLLTALALGLALERPELEIAARRILEALAREAIEVAQRLARHLAHDPLIDALTQQQHFQSPLSQLLDVGSGACRPDALRTDLVEPVLPGLQ